MMDFDAAFDRLMQHEGGYSDHPADPGGKTRYGITEAVARRAGYAGDMQALPLDLAKRIAKAEYWDAVRAGDLPPAVRYAVFDAAYNSGPGQAARWLQRAVKAVEDGRVGPATVLAVKFADPVRTASRVCGYRLDALTRMPVWPTHGKGLARRVASILMEG